jgi:hypothetical protein
MFLRTTLNDGLGLLATPSISHGCKCCIREDQVTKCSNRAFTISITNSSLRPPLRHPAKPIQRTRRTNIEADVNPQESEVSPPVSKANAVRFQERRRRTYWTVLAHPRGQRIDKKAACGANIC